MIDNLIFVDSFHVFIGALALLVILRRRCSLTFGLQAGISLLLIWAYLSSWPVFKNLMLLQLEQQYPRIDVANIQSDREKTDSTANLIVLLTAGYSVLQQGQYQLRLDENGWERVKAAADLWHVIGGTLVISGDIGQPGAETMAAEMRDVAIALGVSADAIELDNQSRDTFDSMQALAELDRPTALPYKMWLVTSAYHMPRAMLAARAFGLRIQAYPCDFLAADKMRFKAWLPNPGVDWSLIVHEYVGLLYYKLRALYKIPPAQ